MRSRRTHPDWCNVWHHYQLVLAPAPLWWIRHRNCWHHVGFSINKNNVMNKIFINFYLICTILGRNGGFMFRFSSSFQSSLLKNACLRISFSSPVQPKRCSGFLVRKPRIRIGYILTDVIIWEIIVNLLIWTRLRGTTIQGRAHHHA